MKITYKEFKDQLRSGGYSDREIVHLFQAFKEMDNQSRLWVIYWVLANRLPEDEIQGVTARYLIEEMKYTPINAFIVLDWLKTDPQAAKYFVLKRAADANIGETAARQIDEIMRAEGVELPPQASEPEKDAKLDAD